MSYICLDTNEAIEELLRYDETELPPQLIYPAWLLAMQLEYGWRKIASGRIRRMVELYLIWESRNAHLTPDYEPPLKQLARNFQADVEAIKKKLEYNPDNKRVEFYWKRNRQYYHSPYMIAGLLYEDGTIWATKAHVEEAMRQLHPQHTLDFQNNHKQRGAA